MSLIEELVNLTENSENDKHKVSIFKHSAKELILAFSLTILGYAIARIYEYYYGKSDDIDYIKNIVKFVPVSIFVLYYLVNCISIFVATI
jgi:hypothetical protein